MGKPPLACHIQLERLGEQIVEVQCAQRLQAGAIGLVLFRFDARLLHGRTVFDTGDGLQQVPRASLLTAEHLLGHSQRLALGNQAHLAQERQADGVEGSNGHLGHGPLAAEPRLEPLAHLVRSLIGEGHGGDLIGLTPCCSTR